MKRRPAHTGGTSYRKGGYDMFETYYFTALLRYRSTVKIWLRLCNENNTDEDTKTIFDTYERMNALKAKIYRYGFACRKKHHEIVKDIEAAES